MNRRPKRNRAREEDESVSSSAIEDLPSLILMDIISRLPVKTVMAIRCVCKSLLDLVSDSYFTKLHSERAPTELLLRCHREEEDSFSTILYIAEAIDEVDLDKVIYEVFSYIDIDMKFGVLLDLPWFSVRPKNDLNFTVLRGKLTLVNTCNGLVCYCGGPVSRRFAVICNPITGEYITIPGPDRKDYKTIKIEHVFYGFGFSLKDNRFKLLRLLCQKNFNVDPLIGDIYTFGEGGSWKKVDNSPAVNLPENPTLYEGVLHWCSRFPNDIVTFDFDNEQFGKINPPHFRAMERDSVFTGVGVFGDCLYINCSVEDYVEVWFMREYGVESSWFTTFSIPRGDGARFAQNIELIKYLHNGEILMFQNSCCIVCYNPDTRSVKSFGECNRDCEAISIRPSIVSLKVMLGNNVTARSDKSWVSHKKRRGSAKLPSWWTRVGEVYIHKMVKEPREMEGESFEAVR